MSEEEIPGAVYLNGDLVVGGEPQRAEYVMIFDDFDVPPDVAAPFDRFVLKGISLRNALRLDSPLAPAEGRRPETARTLGYEDVVDFMIAQAKHPDPVLRHRAIRALGLLGDRRAIPVLVEALRDDSGLPAESFYYPKWPEDRVPMGEVDAPMPFASGAALNAPRAIAALACLNATEAVPALTALLGDQRFRFKAGVADALGQLGTEEVVPLLEAMRDGAARSGDANLAYWCNRGILHIRARAADQDSLIRQLEDRNAAAVYYAVQELAERRSEVAVHILEKLCDDQRLVGTSLSYPTLACSIGTYAKWCVAAIRHKTAAQGGDALPAGAFRPLTRQ